MQQKDTNELKEEEADLPAIRSVVDLAEGEIVAGTVGVEVVELCVDGHGDGGFRGTVGEEEAIFIGDGDGVGMAEGWGR